MSNSIELFNKIQELINEYINNTDLKCSNEINSLDMTELRGLKVLDTKHKTLLTLVVNELDDEVFDTYAELI